MQKKDLHIHTAFSDGSNTPEECVIAAIEKGLQTVGISDHSYIDDTTYEPYWLKKDAEQDYKRTVTALKEKYKDKIEVLLGIEQDYYSFAPASGYDYIIGSVHFLRTDDGFFAIDENLEDMRSHIEFFDNDIYNFVDLYYGTVADVVNKTNCDIIGHFDLITKFNGENLLFDEKNERYIAAYKKAANALIETGKPFEINTSALYRGLKKEPYPSYAVIDYLKSLGAKFILSSDAHKKENIARSFEINDLKKYL
ncbi:MAG: histidinol-phosphatase [Clostridia bacterium]|nr:histidinol-phosphatase [Clostridia bacterium]